MVENWEYFKSIHADLAKQPMLERKWILVTKKSCVDIFQRMEDAVEKAAYRFPDQVFCIINFRKEFKRCNMASTHIVGKKMLDFQGGFGPMKPTSVGVGYGDWVANEELEKKSYPVKSVRYMNMSVPVVRSHRDEYGNEEPPKWVVLRLCTENDKQYHGLYIGEVSNYKHLNYDEKRQEITIIESEFSTNPVIYVPALNKCVFGCECWWKPVVDLNPEEGISDDQLEKARQFFATMLSIASEKGREKVGG